MPGELTGTRRAYDRCGGCGHARQRHQGGGRGPCTHWSIPPNDRDACPGPAGVKRCPCPDFIEPTEGN